MTQWNLTDSFDFDGREVRYGTVGAGPPLVIVHGTPWSSFNMRHLINALSASFRVHFHDLIGYGQSDRQAGDVSLAIQNQVLDRLIDHWGLANPSVIGHDFGGATVLRTHLLNARAFDRIVLIDAVALSPWGSPFFQHVRQHEAAFAGVPDYIHEAIVRAYIDTAAHQAIGQDTMNRTLHPWSGAPGKAAFYRQIAQADSAFTDEVQGSYSTITRPVLILWGEEDSWIPLERGRQLHAMMPQPEFHAIADSGHLVIEEQPAMLGEKIEAFLLGAWVVRHSLRQHCTDCIRARARSLKGGNEQWQPAASY